ncbi:MAG: hypothetical protein DME97_00460 [Verrucomicrobia bacterium]|nr:MAG: hypothetical protein DME97_00460 [Verrucomicrobiota bacterium]
MFSRTGRAHFCGQGKSRQCNEPQEAKKSRNDALHKGKEGTSNYYKIIVFHEVAGRLTSAAGECFYG